MTAITVPAPSYPWSQAVSTFTMPPAKWSAPPFGRPACSPQGKTGGRIHLSHSVQLFHLIRNAPRKGQRHGIDRRDIVPGLNALVLPSQPRNLLQHRFLLRQQLVMSRVSSAGKQERVPLQRNNDLHQLTVVMPGRSPLPPDRRRRLSSLAVPLLPTLGRPTSHIRPLPAATPRSVVSWLSSSVMYFSFTEKSYFHPGPTSV